MRRFVPYALMPLALAGCIQRPAEMASEDSRIDYILGREMGRRPVCLHIVSLHLAQPKTGRGVPTRLSPASFREQEVKDMAARIANGEGEEIPIAVTGAQTPRPGGDPSCAASITRPMEAGDISIVQFAAPNGLLGAYAFRRKPEGWRPVERVKLGYW